MHPDVIPMAEQDRAGPSHLVGTPSATDVEAPIPQARAGAHAVGASS
jgi:hypothetical protein